MGEPELSRARGGSGSAGHLIRPVTLDDVPWLSDVVHYRYGAQFSVDKRIGAEFLWKAMNSPHWVCLRGERTFGMALWENQVFNGVRRIGTLYLLAALPGKDWEPYYTLAAMVKWLRQQGCRSIGGSSETEYDIAPLMKRLGGKEYKTYVIEAERLH